MTAATRMQQPGEKFGTFLGVYTPSVLTILGLIMYLRFGWVVGNVGLGITILIVLLSSSITFITAMSASASSFWAWADPAAIAAMSEARTTAAVIQARASHLVPSSCKLIIPHLLSRDATFSEPRRKRPSGGAPAARPYVSHSHYPIEADGAVSSGR